MEGFGNCADLLSSDNPVFAAALKVASNWAVGAGHLGIGCPVKTDLVYNIPQFMGGT